MHLSIIAAGFLVALIPFAESLLIVVFLGLKTLVDLKSHELQHEKDERQATSP
jgi:hypothetical protein